MGQNPGSVSKFNVFGSTTLPWMKKKIKPEKSQMYRNKFITTALAGDVVSKFRKFYTQFIWNKITFLYKGTIRLIIAGFDNTV